MFGHIERLGTELERAWFESAGLRLPDAPFDRVVIAAMGGSAAAADYFAILASKKSPFPVEVIRGYDLPRHVSQSALVVVLSYSGTTQEAISCYLQAGERGASRFAISTGGDLAERAHSDGVSWHQIRYDSQPRAALAHSLAPLLRIGDRTGAIALCDSDLVDAARAHTALVRSRLGRHIAADSNPAKQLAELLLEADPLLILGADHTAPAARRTKNQMAENAKTLAAFEELPEATHNITVGLEHRHSGTPIAVAFDAPSLHPDNRRRLAVLAALFEEAGGQLALLQGHGTSRLADLLECTAWGDFLSCYLAVLRGIDPTPTPSLARMRQAMSPGPVA